MKLFIPRKDHSKADQIASDLRTNWRTLENWANGQIKVLSYSFPQMSNSLITTGFPTPYPIEMYAFHAFVPTLGTSDSVFDLLKNGVSILPAQLTISHTGSGWGRIAFPAPKYLVSIADVLASRAAAPDILQAECVTAGAGASGAYCGVEYH